MDKKIPLVYSCSGCSSAAQMANWIALEMDRKGVAEMSCIAGIGGGVGPLVEKAKSADIIIGIDGCALHCVEHCLKKEGLKSTFHFDLSKQGVIKKRHQTFDIQEAKKVEFLITRDLESHGIAVNSYKSLK
jgi:uncharacterized metal-binding protein